MSRCPRVYAVALVLNRIPMVSVGLSVAFEFSVRVVGSLRVTDFLCHLRLGRSLVLQLGPFRHPRRAKFGSIRGEKTKLKLQFLFLGMIATKVN